MADLRRFQAWFWSWFASRTRAQQIRILGALALVTVAGVVVYGRLPAITVTCGVSSTHQVEVPL